MIPRFGFCQRSKARYPCHASCAWRAPSSHTGIHRIRRTDTSNGDDGNGMTGTPGRSLRSRYRSGQRRRLPPSLLQGLAVFRLPCRHRAFPFDDPCAEIHRFSPHRKSSYGLEGFPSNHSCLTSSWICRICRSSREGCTFPFVIPTARIARFFENVPEPVGPWLTPAPHPAPSSAQSRWQIRWCRYSNDAPPPIPESAPPRRRRASRPPQTRAAPAAPA